MCTTSPLGPIGLKAAPVDTHTGSIHQARSIDQGSWPNLHWMNQPLIPGQRPPEMHTGQSVFLGPFLQHQARGDFRRWTELVPCGGGVDVRDLGGCRHVWPRLSRQCSRQWPQRKRRLSCWIVELVVGQSLPKISCALRANVLSSNPRK